MSMAGDCVLSDNPEAIDEGNRAACPFCYVEINLSVLSDHFQEDHCFDVTNAVCPVCALNMGKDIVGHFRTYHSSSNKGRRRSRKSGFRCLSSVKNGADVVDGSIADPLLSPFLCSIPSCDSKEDRTRDLGLSEDILPINQIESSIDRSHKKEDATEWKKRALFCQQLVFSTII